MGVCLQTGVAVPDAVVSAAAGGCHNVALTVDGSVYSWSVALVTPILDTLIGIFPVITLWFSPVGAQTS